MMTIAPIASSNGYYENNPEGNYYLDDQLQSKFVGKGAEDLNIINQPVSKEIQENLMKGILPTGETTKRFDTKHRSGYDLTFSAPKSVSVLSLVLGDTRLIDAHKRAVEQTINEIETLASVRNRNDGVYTIENTNNLIVALHTHDTSRELDPQLHTHSLVFNLTKNNNGEWQSLSSDKINKTGFIESVYINQIAFGSIYRQLLKREVSAMGFKIINKEKGLWEIDGVPTEEFSKRRAQIVNEVGENATAKEREIATLSTRNIKTKIDKDLLHKEWTKKLELTGFNKEKFYNQINLEEPALPTKSENEDPNINKNTVNEASKSSSEKDKNEQQQEQTKDLNSKPEKTNETIELSSESSKTEQHQEQIKESGSNNEAIGQSNEPNKREQQQEQTKDLNGKSEKTNENIEISNESRETEENQKQIKESKEPGSNKENLDNKINTEEPTQPIESKNDKLNVNKNVINEVIELPKRWIKKIENIIFNRKEVDDKTNLEDQNLDVNKYAVDKAIELLSESKGQLTYHDILNTALSYSSKDIGVINELKENINIAIEENIITPLDENKSVFVSRINLEREKLIIEKSYNLNNRDKKIKNNFDGIPKEVSKFFSDKGNIGIFTGEATLSTQIKRFEKLNDVAQQNKLNPLIIVKSERIKKQYNTKGIENILTINKLNENIIDSRTLIIVDNAESLSLKNYQDLLTISENKNSLIALMNSKAQIGTGNTIELLKQNGTNEYKFKDNTEVNVKIKSISDQNVRYEQLVKDFVNEQKNKGNAVILSNNEKERQLLTNLTRNELQKNNLLGQQETSIEVSQYSYLSPHQKNNIENYKQGMILENWKDKSLSSYMIASVDEKRNLINLVNREENRTIKLTELDKYWSLIEIKTIKISENEKLITTAPLLNGTIKSHEELTVTKIEEKGFNVIDEKGNTHHLSFDEKHKIEYNHIKKQTSTISDDKTVFVPLTNKSLSQNTRNQLIKTGGEIIIYSPVSYEETEKKLERIKNITLISERLKGNEYSSIDEAIAGRKETVLNDVQKAVNLAIGITQKSNVFFPLSKLYNEALKIDETLNPIQISREILNRQLNKEIHVLHAVKNLGQQIGISDEIYQQEKKIQTIIIKGIGSNDPLLSAEQISKANFEHLTKGQKEATTHILSSTDKFIGIQGLAGVGKTTQLKSVLQELKNNNSNIEVIGLAPTHKAVYELQSVGVKAQTISSFLVDAFNEINNNPNFNLKDKLFLIDESSMIGNKNIASLYEIISQYGGRGIYSGDSKQLLSIESGAAFSFLQNHTELKFSIMNEIVRQNKELKPAVYALLKNQTRKALSIINSISTEKIIRDSEFKGAEKNVIDKVMIGKLEYETIEEYIAKDYSSRDKATRDNTIIVTQRNKNKNEINQNIHNELFKLNKLGISEHTIKVLEPVLINEYEMGGINTYYKNIGKILLMDKSYYRINSVDEKLNVVRLKSIYDEKQTLILDPKMIGKYNDSSIYKKTDLKVSEGDKILINRTNIDKGFTANSEWTISNININKDNNKINLTNESGENKIIDLNNATDLHFTFGYARTDYSSQGASSKFAIVYEESSKRGANMRSTYVGISRAVEHVTFITSNIKDWIKNVGKIEDRLSATDIIESQKPETISEKINEEIKEKTEKNDSKSEFEQIKNKTNLLDLETPKEKEIKSNIDKIINQKIEENKIGDEETISKYNLQDINNKKELMVDDFIRSTKDNIDITNNNKELNKVIDEKTL